MHNRSAVFTSFSGFPEVVEWERQYLTADEQAKYEGSIGGDLGSG